MPPIKPVANKPSHSTYSTPGTSSTPATQSSGSHQHPTLSSPPIQKQLGTNNTRKVTENLYGKPHRKYLTQTSSPNTMSSPGVSSPNFKFLTNMGQVISGSSPSTRLSETVTSSPATS